VTNAAFEAVKSFFGAGAPSCLYNGIRSVSIHEPIPKTEKLATLFNLHSDPIICQHYTDQILLSSQSMQPSSNALSVHRSQHDKTLWSSVSPFLKCRERREGNIRHGFCIVLNRGKYSKVAFNPLLVAQAQLNMRQDVMSLLSNPLRDRNLPPSFFVDSYSSQMDHGSRMCGSPACTRPHINSGAHIQDMNKSHAVCDGALASNNVVYVSQ
jgi:hypothetical protein